jgi:predicted phage terminase large subunit-like protein
VIPKWNKYIPHEPYPKQQAFLWLTNRDVFYGGAAGGGKSDALLMAALQYVDIPGYNAVLFRDTYANLSKSEGLLDRAHEWLQNTDAVWNGEKKFYRFPSSARIWFSYLDGPMDHFNHQGAAYQFVGVDEVVNVRENQALYVGFSRCRKKTAKVYKKDLQRLTNYSNQEIENFYQEYKNIPLRFRAASNPPTAEQLAKGAWVKKRYVDEDTRGKRIFIPATIDDNPALDKDEYIEGLMHLDPVTRAQLIKGDWLIKVKGRMFDRDWFHIVDQAPITNTRKGRFWDPAHTEPATKKNKAGTTDPDWFCGCKGSVSEHKLFYIENMRRWRKTPLQSEIAVKAQAAIDGRACTQTIEREPAAGTSFIDNYIRILRGYVCRGYTSPKGYKNEQAMALASYAEAGNVYIVNGPWVEEFLDEIEVYPDGLHDDQLRACIGIFNELIGAGGETNVRWL